MVNTNLFPTIDLSIQKSSWKNQPKLFKHAFPPEFAKQPSSFTVSLMALLLTLGEITTPFISNQSGIAKLWPLLRYLHIVAPTSDFRFSRDWAHVDSHQKTIASDDFGVAVAMYYLLSRFVYLAVLDGRVFHDALVNRQIARYARHEKTGKTNRPTTSQ